MDSYNFCKEFGSFFGLYKKYKIKNKQSILTTKKNLISSARSIYRYEMSLYLDIPVSKLKSKHNDTCNYLSPLCQKIYLRFRKNSESYVKKEVWLNTRADVFYINVFHITDMYKTPYRKIFYDCNFTCQYIIYETLVVLFTSLYRRRRKRILINSILTKISDQL